MASPCVSGAQLRQRAAVLAEEPHDVRLSHARGHSTQGAFGDGLPPLWSSSTAGSCVRQAGRRDGSGPAAALGELFRLSLFHSRRDTIALLPGAVRGGQPQGCVSVRGGCSSPLLPAARWAEDAAPMPLRP